MEKKVGCADEASVFSRSAVSGSQFRVAARPFRLCRRREFCYFGIIGYFLWIKVFVVFVEIYLLESIPDYGSNCWLKKGRPTKGKLLLSEKENCAICNYSLLKFSTLRLSAAAAYKVASCSKKVVLDFDRKV